MATSGGGAAGYARSEGSQYATTHLYRLRPQPKQTDAAALIKAPHNYSPHTATIRTKPDKNNTGEADQVSVCSQKKIQLTGYNLDLQLAQSLNVIST